jgi:NarL family two-component system response regulator LiaR
VATVPIRLLIAEDHSLVREGTRRILEQHPEVTVVAEVGDGILAVEETVRLKPDVALIDIRMPGLSGVEVTRLIRDQCPNTAVLVLSAFDDDDYVSALLDAGASGYLLKTVRSDELVEAVRQVHRGQTALHPAIAHKIARLLARKSHAQPDEARLTSREMDVLRLVCRGLLNKEIARELGVSVRTIEGHVNGIFNRLGVRSRTEAAMYAASRSWFSANAETA